jgi:hypothetical protein
LVAHVIAAGARLTHLAPDVDQLGARPCQHFTMVLFSDPDTSKEDTSAEGNWIQRVRNQR